MMHSRRLAGQDVGAIGLGCMSFGGAYGATTEADSFACMARAVDLGVSYWDVAERYGDGLCEEVMGKFLRQSNAQVSIATKAGIMSKPTRHARNDEATLRAALEGSLRRLGREHVELFYIHRRDQALPIADVMGTLTRFIDEGKIGAIGFSEIAPSTLRQAHAIHPVAAIQSEYSLWTRQPELGMLQACAELGVAFVAFSPLGRGVFADRAPDPAEFPPGDFRTGTPRFSAPDFATNMALIDPFRAFCADRGWSTASVAIAWVLAQGDHILPIPGTRTAQNLNALAEGAAITLNADDMAEIARLMPVGFAHGERYSPAQWPNIENYC